MLTKQTNTRVTRYQGRFEKLFEELEARYGYAEELSGEDPVAGTSPSASGYGYGGGASSAPPPVPSRPSAPSVTKAPAPPAPAVAAAAPAPAPAPAPAAPVSASVANPFDDFDDEPEDAGKPWALEGDKATYGAIFQSLNPQNGKLSGGDCKQTVLAVVWMCMRGQGMLTQGLLLLLLLRALCTHSKPVDGLWFAQGLIAQDLELG